MSTFRVPRHNNFCTIANYPFKDRNLSWKARGILATMLSLPPEWDFSMNGLTRLANDGIRSTMSAIHELEASGYLVRRPVRKDGKIADWEYCIYEKPIDRAEGKKASDEDERGGVENVQVDTVKVENVKVENARQVIKDIYMTNISDQTSASSFADAQEDAESGQVSPAGLCAPQVLLDVDSRDVFYASVSRIWKSGEFSHRLPEENGKATEIYRDSVSFIKEVMDRNFLSRYFDPEWMDRNVTEEVSAELFEANTLDKATGLICKACERFALMKRPEYLPSDKKMLPTTFADFMYNPRTCKSTFIRCLSEEPETARDKSVSDALERFPRQLDEAMDELGLRWSRESIAKSVSDLAEWQERTGKLIYESCGDYSSYGLRKSDFWQLYCKYLDELLDGGEPSPGHFRPYGRTHQSFMQYMRNEYGISYAGLRNVPNEDRRGLDISRI